MIGQVHIECAQSPGHRSGQCDVGGGGEGASGGSAVLIEGQPLPVMVQHATQDGAPFPGQRHAMAGPPGGVEDQQVQSIDMGHDGRMPRRRGMASAD